MPERWHLAGVALVLLTWLPPSSGWRRGPAPLRMSIDEGARKLQGLSPMSKGDVRLAANSGLLEWLQNGGVYVSDKSDWGQAPHPMAIAVETFDMDNSEPSGRGLLARREINEGEELVVIPIAMCMTKKTAEEVFPAGTVSGLDDYLALALLLQRELSLGKDSAWAPYLSVLPTLQEVNPTFAWGDAELDALEGSPLRASTRSMQAKLQGEWSMLQEGVMKAHPDAFSGEYFTYEGFTWAFSLLFSRAVRLRSLESGERLALVPYADLINHSPFSNAFIDGRSPGGLDKLLGLKEEEVVLYADRSYKQMEQVTISYGQKSNAELLLLYGFALDRNPFNSVDIGVAIADDDDAQLDEPDRRLQEAKRKFLDRRGRDEEAAFPVYADRYPEEMLEYLRLLALSHEDLSRLLLRRKRMREASTVDQLRAAALSLVDTDGPAGGAEGGEDGAGESLEMGVGEIVEVLDVLDFREFISSDNEQAALAALKAATQAALARYPTTEDQDAAIMQDGPMFRTLPREVRMAVRHRRSEKRILARTIAVVEKDLAAMAQRGV